MMVKLKIESRRDWNEICGSLRRNGYLKGASMNETTLPESAFPIEIPVDISSLLQLAGKPMAKLVKGQIDQALTVNVKRIKPSLV